MVLRPAKMNIFGNVVAKPLQNVPDDLLQAAELTALYYILEKAIGGRTLTTRLAGFMGTASVYNWFIKRFQSAESSGTGR